MSGRIGKVQRTILERMRAGESLEQDGWDFFHLVRYGLQQRVSDASCQRLLNRGLIKILKSEEHPGYLGGKWTWYQMTDEGKATLG